MLFKVNLDRSFHDGSELKSTFLRHRPLNQSMGMGLTVAQKPVQCVQNVRNVCLVLGREGTIFI